MVLLLVRDLEEREEEEDADLTPDLGRAGVVLLLIGVLAAAVAVGVLPAPGRLITGVNIFRSVVRRAVVVVVLLAIVFTLVLAWVIVLGG